MNASRFSAVIISILTSLCPYSATLAQNGAAPQSPASDVDTQKPSAQAREDYRMRMAQIPLPGKGCFEAHYPNAAWQTTTCGVPSKYPNPVARGASPTFVGGGNDYFMQVTGNISSATGSFDSVSGVTTEYGSKFGNLGVVSPNTYSLQLNANIFFTPACSGCLGWEQFILSQSQCSPSACIFIEYWLLNHPSPCPAGGWTFYPGSATTTPGCFINTAVAFLPVQPLADLGILKLSGTVSGGLDIVTLSTASGNIVATAQDSILSLAQGWTGGEYNLVGDCCASEAFFNSGSNITVRLSANNETTNIPSCTTSFNGATAETNNLNITTACLPVGGASPAIVFSESGGGPIPPGTTIKDPHLTTFQGVHYDFQASGDFLLVHADPDFTVHTRQKPWFTPTVAVNTAVGTKMGNTRVAVCLNGLDVNGVHTALDDGKALSLADDVTVSRRSNTYVISRPSGDIVQAQIMDSYINVSVALGLTNPGTVRGLLGGREKSLVTRDGNELHNPISWDTWRQYADGWRVKESDGSLLCHDGEVPPGMPPRQAEAEDLGSEQRAYARAVCMRAGVKDPILLNDCIVDVTLLGKDSAADVFVHAPPIKSVVRPINPPKPPRH